MRPSSRDGKWWRGKRKSRPLPPCWSGACLNVQWSTQPFGSPLVWSMLLEVVVLVSTTLLPRLCASTASQTAQDVAVCSMVQSLSMQRKPCGTAARPCRCMRPGEVASDLRRRQLFPFHHRPVLCLESASKSIETTGQLDTTTIVAQRVTSTVSYKQR